MKQLRDKIKAKDKTNMISLIDAEEKKLLANLASCLHTKSKNFIQMDYTSK